MRQMVGAMLVALAWMSPVSGWSSSAPLNQARYSHTSTLLSDGRILAAGGETSSTGALSSCEIFDPASGTWSATGPLLGPRSQHSATLLSTGKVLVAGGNDASEALSSAELYDPSTGTWTAAAAMGRARKNHTATLLLDGRVLLSGGSSAYDASVPVPECELYDPVSASWSDTGSLSQSRIEHATILFPDGSVLAAGGAPDASGSPALSSCELYLPSLGTWFPAGSMTVPRNQFSSTVLESGKVLVAGGTHLGSIYDTCEVYDPAADSWSATGSMVGRRYGHRATLLSDGRVLVSGGSQFPVITGACELYDPSTGSWSETATLADARYGHTTVLLADATVLALGGSPGGPAALSTCEQYTAPAEGGSGIGSRAAQISTLRETTVRPGSGRAPVIASINGSSDDRVKVPSGGRIQVKGAFFRGVAEGGDGSERSSSTDHPILRLVEHGKNGRKRPQEIALIARDWHYGTGFVADLPRVKGLWTLQITVSGVQGAPKTLHLLPEKDY